MPENINESLLSRSWKKLFDRYSCRERMSAPLSVSLQRHGLRNMALGTEFRAIKLTRGSGCKLASFVQNHRERRLSLDYLHQVPRHVAPHSVQTSDTNCGTIKDPIMTIMNLIVFIIAAGLFALLLDLLLPEAIPGGVVTAGAVGILGAWLGTMLFGQYGPEFFNVHPLPSVLGAGFLVSGLAVFCNSFCVRGVI